MRIISLKATGIHGYMDIDIKFNKDITMLHGINGAGKTTAVRSIMALINPDIHWLISTEFSDIEVVISQGQRNLSISAMKNSDNLVLSVNNASLNNENLGITKYDLRRFNKDMMDDPVFYSYPIDEIAKYKSIDFDDAVEIIKGIPSPTFLGLERTTLNQKNEDAHRTDKRTRSGMQVYSRLSMDESLTEAVRLARSAYNENYIKKRNEAANEFKFSVFTSLFEIDAKEDRSVVLPNSNELERQQQAVRRTIAVIQQAQLLPDVYINNTVRPFFEYYLKVYEETSAAISSNRNRPIKNFKNINETLVKWVTIDASFLLLSV